jgi:fatty-acyl-CoA synthase
VLTLDKEDAARKAGSSGKPVLHTEVRIVRPDGTDADVGELGELWVRGPNVTPGYWNRPDANASSFTDGWLHTGDATRVDEDGYYYIVDRWKDMYISGGENVYPAEVEAVLTDHDAVLEAAVIGVADERWGEVGHAIIRLRPGHTCEVDALRAFARSRLAAYKVPKHVTIVDDFPRTAAGKVQKHVLRRSLSPPAGRGSG